MLILYGLVMVLAWYLARELYLRTKYDLHKIPSPKGLPILRQTIDFMTAKEVTQTRGKWHESLGRPKIFKVVHTPKAPGMSNLSQATFFGLDLVYVTDSEYYKSTVLGGTKQFPRYPPRGVQSVSGAPKDCLQLVRRLENSPYVKAIRRAYLTAFTTNNLKKFVPRVEGVVEKMIEIVNQKREDGPIDFQKLCVKMTLDTIGEVVFEHHLGGLDGSGSLYQLLIEAGYLANNAIRNPLQLLYCAIFPNSELAVRRKKVYGDLHGEWYKLADLCLKRDPPSDGTQPLWYTLRTLVNPETGKPLTRDLYSAEFTSVIIAGMDTTGHQLSWILGMLAAHPRVSEKLYEEIKHLEGKEIELEELASLAYLSAVVKEGMRVCGVSIAAFNRQTPEDMVLMGYRVPKGTVVTIPGNRSMDCDADWGDAKTVRPERWIEEEIPPSRHFLGFSYGSRDCVGQRFALMEMKVALIKLLLKYKFSTKKSFEELLENTKNGIAIEAVDGMWLEAKPRFTNDVSI